MPEPVKKKPKWGETIIGPNGPTRNYPLHKYQREVLSSTARINFAFAGTGGGKSCLIPLWLIKQIQKNNGKGRYLVVSPTYKIFKQSQLLDKWKEAVQGTQLEGGMNKTDAIYTCGTGAEVYFRSGDNPDSLEGGQYQALALDEAAKLTYDAWIKASARVGAEQGPILGVSTPDINNWIFTEIFKLCDGETRLDPDDGGAIRTSKDGQLKVVQWRSTINPTYSKAELERQRKTLSPAVFARRYLGEFAKLEGLVYETFVESVQPQKCPDILPSPAVRVCGAIDWGWNDPLSVLVGVECQDGIVYVVEEIYETKLPLDALADKLQRLRKKWAVDTFYCDHSRPEIRDQLRRLGLPCQIKKVAQIETGVAMVDARLRTGYLKVYPDCVHLIEEASHYQRKTVGEGDYSEKPVDKDNHSCDALRYLITGNDFGRRLNFSESPGDDLDPSDFDLQADIRLGRKSSSPEERRRQEEAEAERLYKTWFNEFVNAEAD